MADHDTSRASRRTVLLAAALTASAASCAAPDGQRSTAAPPPACVLTAEAGEGPYYLDLDKVRSDITEGREGVPLRLDLTLVRVSAGCRPLADAAVDVWHADAAGDYSTGGATFLRGTQVTDTAGRCVFRTVVPGWYAGLAPHIHFKVRPGSGAGTTSQFFFPEDLLRQVYARRPYSRRPAPAHPNERDSRYRATGAAMTLALRPEAGGAGGAGGYRAAYTVGIA
ncbi:intradiol ring-cleavage dioxygenase [Streptomyces sp. NBC_00249]|uniref:dioxygenase family protein n=1 Tax=Streptomyces sp. NBC_00249 TaxID=2975690 RepID=UPI00225613C5|nr:intradiol ring-cleavage dioxygenase [Streptomyces sp. NBC_00249]MCX5192555.1 intradiol ring-cleavage dioxygenase [Streptomyces sp. NBC_00249]